MTEGEYEALLMLAEQVGQANPQVWAKIWLQQPHPKLDGRKPIDCFTSRLGLTLPQ